MWTSADSYCDRMKDRYDRATKLIEKYKNSKNEDLIFIAECLKEEFDKNYKLDSETTEQFKQINYLKYTLDNYKAYSRNLSILLKDRANYVEHLRRIYKIEEGE